MGLHRHANGEDNSYSWACSHCFPITKSGQCYPRYPSSLLDRSPAHQIRALKAVAVRQDRSAPMGSQLAQEEMWEPPPSLMSHSMRSNSVNGSAPQILLFLHGHYWLGVFPLTERTEKKSLGAVQACQHCRSDNLGMHCQPSQVPGDGDRQAPFYWAKGMVLGAPAFPHTSAPSKAGGSSPRRSRAAGLLSSGTLWTKAFVTLEHLVGNNWAVQTPQRKARADLQRALSLTCHLLLQGSSSPEPTEPSACYLFIYLVKMSLGRFMFQPFVPLREEIMEDLAGDAHTHQHRDPPHHLCRNPWEGITLV